MDSKIVRKLARSNRYQFLFNHMKENGNIEIFENKSELSNIQVSFLQWMQIYSIMYTDLKMKEPYISEEVINDNLRADSYLLYRTKIKDNTKKQVDTKKRTKISTHSNIPSVIFTKKGQ